MRRWQEFVRCHLRDKSECKSRVIYASCSRNSLSFARSVSRRFILQMAAQLIVKNTFLDFGEIIEETVSNSRARAQLRARMGLCIRFPSNTGTEPHST